MHLERTFAHIVAVFIVVVGLLFGLASVFRMPFLHIAPQGEFFVLIISIVFAAVGIGAFYLLGKGRLRKEGVSMSEVRQEAIEKMKDLELLSRIALKDSDSGVRELAQERLKEIKD